MNKQATPGARRLGPASRAALELLGCCPRLPADVVPAFLRSRPGATRQLLSRLRMAGLVRSDPVRPGPLLGGRMIRLWSLTPAGRALALERGLLPSSAVLAHLHYGAPDQPPIAGLQSAPALVAAYRLLGAFAASLRARARPLAWEQPWVRSTGPDTRRRARLVRLPAAAVLEVDAGALLPVLLVPDLGTRPVASYRPMLTRLIALRETMPPGGEPLLVIAAREPDHAAARVGAWHTLLRRLAARAGVPPLRAQVLRWAEPPAMSTSPSTSPVTGSADHLDQVLQLVARHPLLTRLQLAVLLGTSPARVARLERWLADRGWLQPIDAARLPRCAAGGTRDELRRLGLVQLTPAGAREAIRRLVLPGAQAVRHQGIIGGRARARRRLLQHLDHTVGANAIFVTLAHAARAASRRGGDDALVEWRSAAACARGRCRPDGFGVYRRDGSRYGFFLEYDRGTERAREYAAKLEAYYRYRDSGAAARDYAGFPTLLIVTTADGAEARFAREAYLAWQRRGGVPLPILLTTTRRIAEHPYGVLGPIWRAAGGADARAAARGYWLSGGAPRGRGAPGLAGATPAVWPHGRLLELDPPRAALRQAVARGRARSGRGAPAGVAASVGAVSVGDSRAHRACSCRLARATIDGPAAASGVTSVSGQIDPLVEAAMPAGQRRGTCPPRALGCRHAQRAPVCWRSG